MNATGLKFEPAIVETWSPAEIANALLEQTFATDHGFSQLHLNEIEDLFQETHNAQEPLPSTFDQDAPNSRTVALEYFCYLLFAMEKDGVLSQSSETLFELAGREQGTRVITHHGYILPNKTGPIEPDGEPKSETETKEESTQAPKEDPTAIETEKLFSQLADSTEFEGPFIPPASLMEQGALLTSESTSLSESVSADQAWKLDASSIAPLWGDSDFANTEPVPASESTQESPSSPQPQNEILDEENLTVPASSELLAGSVEAAAVLQNESLQLDKTEPPETPAPEAKTNEAVAADRGGTELELEDNSWIEKQFAGIANQLATETPIDTAPAVDEAFEENTASISFEDDSSGETKEITLAVAEEFPPAAEEFAPATIPSAPAEGSAIRSVCAETRDYLGVATFLEGFLHNTDLGFPAQHLIRLSAQSLSHATESEWMHRLGRGLEYFWPRRKDAIVDLLDVTASPARLHPVIKSAVDLIADGNRGLLADDKYPHTSVVSSLQYLLSVDSFEKVKLTLIDMGVLIFFFGADRTLGGLSLKNRLGVVGLDLELNIELAFRLTRMHRLRSRSNSIRKEFSTADLLVLSQDTTRCLELLGKSHSEDSALHPVQVA